MGLFLAAHGLGCIARRIPEQGLLLDPAAGSEQCPLPLDLKGEGALNVPEGIHVLQFGLDAQSIAPGGPEGDVGVAAQAALLHIAGADIEVAHQLAQPLHEIGRLGRRAQVGFGHQLEQGHAAAVEIEQGFVRADKSFGVDRPARVIFKVNAPDADGPLFLALAGDRHASPGGEGQIELGDLITLGQVRIKIVLAGKERNRIDPAAGGQGEPGGRRKHLLVQHRQRTRQAHADRADLAVGLRTELDAAAAKDFTPGLQLDMHLKSDDHLKRGRDLRCRSGAARIEPSAARAHRLFHDSSWKARAGA